MVSSWAGCLVAEDGAALALGGAAEVLPELFRGRRAVEADEEEVEATGARRAAVAPRDAVGAPVVGVTPRLEVENEGEEGNDKMLSVFIR